MKPAQFDYTKPATVDEAIALLVQYGDDASVLAGGQSLVPTLNMRLSTPEILIDITGLDELRGIRDEGGRTRIGALTRHVEVERSSEVAEKLPLIAAALPFIAHPAIRNRGTIGGSLALADPAAEYPACAVALNADIEIASTAGRRKVPAVEFFKDLYETDLQSGELLTAVEFPPLGATERCVFLELARRHGDYALAGIAARATVQDGRIEQACLVFFGVGPKPMLAANGATAVVGRAVDEATIADLHTALDDDLDPFDDMNSSGAYKLHIAKELAGRAVRKLTENEGAMA